MSTYDTPTWAIILSICTIVFSIIFNYFILDYILASDNRTNNLTKLYVIVFVSIQATIFGLIYDMYKKSRYNLIVIIYIVILLAILLYTFYQIKTLEFIDQKEFLLVCSENYGKNISFAKKILEKNNISPQVRQLAEKMVAKNTRDKQIMEQLLINS